MASKVSTQKDKVVPQQQQPQAMAAEAVVNPVGKLQELSQKQLWSLPIYTFECSGADNPATRQFACTVRLQGSSARGVGSSKRLAKRQAAAELLLLHHQHRAAPTPSPTRLHTPPPTPTTTKKAPLEDADFQRLRASKRLQSAGRAGSEVGGMFRGLRNRKAGCALPPIEAPQPVTDAAAAIPGGPGACEQLMELGRTHRFGIQFLLDELDRKDGGYRSVVKLATMPTIVVVGNGRDASDSRERACRAALEYLSLLTNENAAAGKK